MRKKVISKIAAIVFVSAISGIALFAQDRNDVIKVYNEGAKAMQTDLNVAIESFENVVKLSEQVGETVDDLKGNAMKVLPGLYIKAASAAISDKKPAPEYMQAAKDAVAAAEKYNNPAQLANATKILVQAYNTMGAGYFAQNDFENALVTFDSLLAINPDYSTAIYNKSLIYLRQEDAGSFEETIDLFIEKMKSQNDEAKAEQASAMALQYFRSAGSKSIQAENLDEALELLNKGAKYGDDKDLFYYLADVYNKQKNFSQGAECSQKGLDLETGDAEAKAKFYFQLGLAQAGKGQTADSCSSFKNAMFGAFAEAAKAERTNMKCE